MKCPGCGYASLDLLETCKHCGTPMVATTVAPVANRVDLDGDFVEMLDDDGIKVEDDDLDRVTVFGPGSIDDDGDPPFRIDDDLFAGYDADAPGVPEIEEGGEPLIDRYDEVPERYWAPEVAGLGRRALALLADQTVLAAALGIFFLGAGTALRLNGFDTGVILAAAGLRASALPFALLAVVLSLAYYGFFHGSTSRTPGKVLLGLEVRTGDGGAISWTLAIRRWLGAALGLACAGVGIIWAMFEPRHRGWADLISGTVIARRRQESSTEVTRR